MRLGTSGPRASGTHADRSPAPVSRSARRLVLATRRSPLALAQTRAVADALRGAGHEIELLELVTTGDRWSAEAAPGAPAPDKGLFVKELERALLDGRADLAVHSAKDLPADLPDGLAVVATPPREDPGDVLIGAERLEDLPDGTRVGTGSPRRAAQLRVHRPDLRVVEIRGNVGTRVARWRDGEVDALVLARAGLVRLGLDVRPSVPLPASMMVPAPGQGVLAIEGRVGDPTATSAVATVDDAGARACLAAERATLRALGGGCQAPIGAVCESVDDGAVLSMVGFMALDAHGRGARRGSLTGLGDDPEGLGDRLAGVLAG